MREGKTLGMTAFGIVMGVTTGVTPIFSNYHIKYPNFNYFERWKELKNVENSIILYDELGTSFDSRNYKSEDQMVFTHLFSQMGKKGNTLLYTTQRDHQIEKRVREQTDYVIECSKDWSSGYMKQIWFNTQRGRESAEYINTFLILEPELFYEYYNTYEVIKTQISTEQIGTRSNVYRN